MIRCRVFIYLDTFLFSSCKQMINITFNYTEGVIKAFAVKILPGARLCLLVRTSNRKKSDKYPDVIKVLVYNLETPMT